MKNYFTTLELPDDAKPDDIRRAYRQLAKKYHPDVNKSPDAHEKFCEITEAYEFLIHHWASYTLLRKSRETYPETAEYQQQNEAYERLRQEARERAKRQAKMRYEKFRKQHEAFQESGLNDIGLAFTMLFRALSVPIFIFLVLSPLFLALFVHWKLVFVVFFMWPFALGIAWYFHDNRKNYFLPGKFYYSFDRIWHFYHDKRETSEYCYYCKNKTADSKPYKIDLLKLKDIRMQTGGFKQHNVNYINATETVSIPRSGKALVIHTSIIAIKILSIITSMLFMPVDSIVWRLIAGMIAGGILSRILLFVTGTRSNITYLFSVNLIIRACIWLFALMISTRIYWNPFDIYTNDYIHFTIAAIILFDAFLMQLIAFLTGKKSLFPVSKQPSAIIKKFDEGYRVYNDVPVISFIYPLLKWFLG